jgi:hypothetical protein
MLTYASVSGAVGYQVYRRRVDEPISERQRISVQLVPYTWYTDAGTNGAGLPNGEHFVYSVRAMHRDRTGRLREGLASREVMAMPMAPIPPGFLLYYWNTTNPATLAMKYDLLSFQASGEDIWDVTDSGAFLAMPVTGDYSVSVRVVEKPGPDAPNTSGNVKAGVMIREGVGPSDRYAFLFTTSGRGVLWEGNRKTRVGGDGTGPYSQEVATDAETLYPLWLKLTRKGSLVTAFQSNDGSNYLPAGDAQTFSRLTTATYAGIAMSSGNGAGYGSVRFDASSLRVQ